MKLTRDLARTLVEHLTHFVGAAGCLAQHGFADNAIHIGFAEIDPHLEAPQQLLQLRQINERLLPGAHQ